MLFVWADTPRFDSRDGPVELPADDRLADDTDDHGEQSAREVLAFTDDDDGDIRPVIHARGEGVNMAGAAPHALESVVVKATRFGSRPVVVQAFPDAV